MQDDPHQGLERVGVAFFGAMGAGLSHELSNVFNIINELAGLQQDIVAAAAQGGTVGLARVSDLAGRIKAQVERGESINRGLHRLSHCIDDTEADFDVGETLGLFGKLAERAARLAEVELVVRPPETPLTHRGSPFDLLLALHACVRVALAAAKSARRIEVWAEEGPDAVRVTVGSGDPIAGTESDAPQDAILDSGCAALGSVPRIEDAPQGGCRIVLELMSRSAAANEQADGRTAEV